MSNTKDEKLILIGCARRLGQTEIMMPDMHGVNKWMFCEGHLSLRIYTLWKSELKKAMHMCKQNEFWRWGYFGCLLKAQNETNWIESFLFIGLKGGSNSGVVITINVPIISNMTITLNQTSSSVYASINLRSNIAQLSQAKVLQKGWNKLYPFLNQFNVIKHFFRLSCPVHAHDHHLLYALFFSFSIIAFI